MKALCGKQLVSAVLHSHILCIQHNKWLEMGSGNAALLTGPSCFCVLQVLVVYLLENIILVLLVFLEFLVVLF